MTDTKTVDAMERILTVRQLAVAAMIAAGLAVAMPAAAQPMPAAADLAGFTPDVIQKQLTMGLPGLWHLDRFTPQGTINAGNAVEPDIRARFEAQISLTADTFAPDGTDGPVVFVRKIAPAGLQKVLYGLSNSRLQAGTWTTRIDLQNQNVLQGLGEPLATIPGRVVVRGSPDEASFLKQREADAQTAQQQKLADAKRQDELATQQRVAAASAEEAKRQQAQAAAVAQAQQQAAVDAAQAAARREQAQQDEEAAAKLAQTKAADEQAMLERQTKLTTAQHDMLSAREKMLDELRAALQSQSRTDRLAAIDTALDSEDLTIRSLGYDAALGGSDPAAQNVALRKFFGAKRLIVFNVFAPSAWRQGIEAPGPVVSALSGLRLDLKEFDVSSGRFAGTLSFGTNLQWDAEGSIDRNTMSIAARGQGKPIAGLNGGPVSITLTTQLSPQKELDGFAQIGGAVNGFGAVTFSPVIIRVNLN